MKFFVGLRTTGHARHFERCFISVNSLRRIRRPFGVGEWIMDSGAFVEIEKYGDYRHDVSEYAAEIRRWLGVGSLQAVVAQDWMCEPHILKRTGLSVEIHQRRTIARYDELMAEGLPVTVIPVIQGFTPAEYQRCVEMYGDRLAPAAWVGVGSVCKRNSDPAAVLAVLDAIADVREDLRLHGFGVKTTALRFDAIRRALFSADSMAWSLAARFAGESSDDWRAARAFVDEIEAIARPKMLQTRLEL